MKVNKKIVGDLATFIEMRYKINITELKDEYPELFNSFLRLQFWMDEALLLSLIHISEPTRPY